MLSDRVKHAESHHAWPPEDGECLFELRDTAGGPFARLPSALLFLGLSNAKENKRVHRHFLFIFCVLFIWALMLDDVVGSCLLEAINAALVIASDLEHAQVVH